MKLAIIIDLSEMTRSNGVTVMIIDGIDIIDIMCVI